MTRLLFILFPFLILPFSHYYSSCSILSILADQPLPLFQIPLPIAPLYVIVLSLFVLKTHVKR